METWPLSSTSWHTTARDEISSESLLQVDSSRSADAFVVSDRSVLTWPSGMTVRRDEETALVPSQRHLPSFSPYFLRISQLTATMPDNPSFTPARQSSLRNAVAQMESLSLSQASTPASQALSSTHSSTPSLSGLNDRLEAHKAQQEQGESLVESPGTRAREGSETSDGGDKSNTFYGATTPLYVQLQSLSPLLDSLTVRML